MTTNPPDTLAARRLAWHLDEWENPDHYRHVACDDHEAVIEPSTIHFPNADTLRSMLLQEIRTVVHQIGEKRAYIQAIRRSEFHTALAIEIDYAVTANAYVLLAALRTPNQVNVWTRPVNPDGSMQVTVHPTDWPHSEPQAGATNEQVTLMQDLMFTLDDTTPCPWYDSRFPSS
jgi:hypothetical protein